MTTQAPTKKWSVHKIKDFGVVSTGSTPSTKKKEYYGGKYKLISPADLTDSKYIFTSHKLITEVGLKVSRTLPRNAVLVGCIGNVGKIGMTTDDVSAFNQQINAVVCNNNYNCDFVYYLLRYSKPLLESRAAKVTLPILNKSNFENLSFEVPELPEQKVIAQTLTTVQNTIAEQEKVIEKLKELKRSMMQHLFTHGTKGEKTKMTEIGEVLESWKVVDFESLCVLQRGKDLTKSDFKSGSVPVAGSNGIIGYHDVANVKAPAITVGRSGSVGLVRYYDQDVWAHNTALYVKDFKGNDERFTGYYLEHLKLSSFKGGASVPTLDRNQFRTMLLAIPSHAEQLEIAKTLMALDTKNSATIEKLSAYQNLFKTLLHELMSGERRIK